MTAALFSKNEDLYALLKVSSAASASDVRKAYLRLALAVHPDRNPSESATAEFQKLSAAYAILSDTERRASYDAYGLNADGTTVGGGPVGPQLSEEDVRSFEKAYVGSEAQRADVVAVYVQVNGNVKRFLDTQILASARNLDIYREMIEKARESNPDDVPFYPKFWDRSQDDRLVRREEEERAEAESMLAELRQKKGKKNGGAEKQDLAAMILSRGKSRFDTMIDSLESKYAGGKSNAKAATPKAKPARSGAKRAASSSKGHAGWDVREEGDIDMDDEGDVVLDDEEAEETIDSDEDEDDEDDGDMEEVDEEDEEEEEEEEEDVGNGGEDDEEDEVDFSVKRHTGKSPKSAPMAGKGGRAASRSAGTKAKGGVLKRAPPAKKMRANR